MEEKVVDNSGGSQNHIEFKPPVINPKSNDDIELELERDLQVANENRGPFRWDYDVITNLLACWMCFFVSTWMLVVPSGIIGFISEAFPQEAHKSVWIAAAVAIPNCVLQSFLGGLSDHLGRKIFLLVGMCFGLAGSLITGRASGMNMVIGGQVLSGIGLTCGYLAIPLTSELVPKDARPRVQALNGIFAGVANSSGVIIAGAFIKHNVGGTGEGWRMAFYIAAGFYALTIVTLYLFYHPSARPNPHNLSVVARLRLIDWFGVFLIAAGLTIFLVGLEYGGNPYKWSKAIVLAPIIIGGACIVAFGLWESIGTKTGLLHHSLFEHSNFPLVLLLNFVGGIVLFGGQAFLPQEIIYLFTQDALLTGVYNLPFNLMGIMGGIVGGVSMALTKEAKAPIVASFVILLVGSGLAAVMEPHINFAAWFFPTTFLGFSIGLQTALLSVVVSVCTPNHLIAHAISLSSSSRAFGGSIGVVIFSQVFASRVKKFLPAQVAEVAIKAGLPITSVPSLLEGILAQNATMIAQTPGFSLSILSVAEKAVSQAYADSFRFVWYSLIPFASISLILSLFLKSTKAQMTAQIAAGIEHRH